MDQDHDHLCRLNALLEQALSRPESDRQTWLQSLPRAEQAFAPLLQSLLSRASVETDTFMRRPVDVAIDFATQSETGAPPDAPGDVIGPYRLVRELGAGGMSVVWLAERSDGALQRQVALKLPRAGWGLGFAQRMARERDILAGLEHPHIARLYDAGVTEAGRPWLAMEYVEGASIDVHCREGRLDVRARLRLFLQVTAAVAHAHARLVVHRDLKPSNILVTPHGEVRLLDFGVAKLLVDPSGNDSKLTQFAGRAYTRDYASPEHIRGEPLTVAADVYSLGVVLYELLTGERPYKLRHESAAAIEEAILKAEVAPASRRATDSRIARELRGDLDNVLAKATKTRPADRYASVSAFADDLARVLERRPVSARPDAFGYRLTRFVQRNAIAVAAAASVLIAIVAGASAAVWQAREASLQRDRALQELTFAEAADEFMRFLLSERPGKPFTTQDILARADQLVDRQFADDALLRARMQLLVADLYGELLNYTRAEEVLLRARAAAADARDAAIGAHVDCALSAVYSATARTDEALRLHAAALQTLRRLQPPPTQALLACHHQGDVMHYNIGRLDESLAHAQAALQLMGDPRPGQRVQAIFLRATVADAYARTGDAARAIEIYERATRELARLGRGTSTIAASLQNNFAVHLIRTGQLQRAAAVFAQAMQPDGDSPAADPGLQTNYASVLIDLGREREAERLLEQALPQHVADGDHHGAAYARLWLAALACRRPAAGACEASLSDAVERVRATFPAQHHYFAVADLLAGQAALERHQPRAAHDRLQAALATFESLPEPNASRIRALGLLARAQQQIGDSAAARRSAELAVRDARAGMQGLAHSEWLGSALLAQAIVLKEQGDPEAAKAALAPAIEQLEGSVGAEAPAAQQARGLLRTL